MTTWQRLWSAGTVGTCLVCWAGDARGQTLAPESRAAAISPSAAAAAAVNLRLGSAAAEPTEGGASHPWRGWPTARLGLLALGVGWLMASAAGVLQAAIQGQTGALWQILPFGGPWIWWKAQVDSLPPCARAAWDFGYCDWPSREVFLGSAAFLFSSIQVMGLVVALVGLLQSTDDSGTR